MEAKWIMIAIMVIILGAYAGMTIAKHSNNLKEIELAKIKECK